MLDWDFNRNYNCINMDLKNKENCTHKEARYDHYYKGWRLNCVNCGKIFTDEEIKENRYLTY